MYYFKKSLTCLILVFAGFVLSVPAIAAAESVKANPTKISDENVALTVRVYPGYGGRYGPRGYYRTYRPYYHPYYRNNYYYPRGYYYQPYDYQWRGGSVYGW